MKECPPNDRLAQLVSGSLVESRADALLAHVDRCQACQEQMDRLMGRQDPVIAAAKKATNEKVEVDADALLAKLIRKAQQTPEPPTIISDDTKDTQRERASAQTVSLDKFVEGLRKSGLMPEDEVQEALSGISFGKSADGEADTSSFAKWLIAQRKITAFQARLLVLGRWRGLVLGSYEILERLGRGGMGSVFKARHRRMGRIVCLKIINSASRQSSAAIERFRHEARTLAALDHPNIVVAHDANESKGVPYLVMEFIDGDDLAKRVKSEGPLSLEQTLQVLTQTAMALRYAHGEGMIHRDIKPHNLVATDNPKTGELVVKVLDMGLARFDTLLTNNPNASVVAAMTNTGVVIGTVDYMAPEQALDSREADERSDIYSLGCTAYYLLTGRPPFEGETVMQRLIAHREQTPKPLCDVLGSNVTPELSAVVQKMMSRKIDQRYQSMQEVLVDLQAVRNGQSPLAFSDSLSSLSKSSGLRIVKPFVAPNPKLVAKPLRRTLIMNAIFATTALAMLCTAGGLYWASLPRVGPAQAIRNGGNGRALVVVSSKAFNEEELKTLTSSLKDDPVGFVVASPKFGTGDKEYGVELRDPFPNVNIKNAKAEGYDALVFLGGDCWELTHKNPENQKEIKRLLTTAFQEDLVVVGCSQGYDVVMDTHLTKKGEFKDRLVKKAHNSGELTSMLTAAFAELRKQ